MIAADGRLFHDKRGRVREAPLPLAPLADTHGHLFVDMDPDPAACVARAALAGVALLVVPMSPAEHEGRLARRALEDLSRWQEEARRLLDAAAAEGARPPEVGGATPSLGLPEDVRIVAGFHPYDAACMDDGEMRRSLDVLLDDPRCVGVGEFGLDLGPHNDVDPEVQLRAFRAQLRVARERGLPVQLHVRDAADDPDARAHELALRVLEEEGVPEAGCDLHCFTCGPEVLAPFVEAGCHVAFGGAATFKRSDDIREAAAACPAGLLLSETDSPYMAPEPLRGLGCEPAMVAWSVACVASVREEVLGEPAEATYRALWENANRLFPLR